MVETLLLSVRNHFDRDWWGATMAGGRGDWRESGGLIFVADQFLLRGEMAYVAGAVAGLRSESPTYLFGLRWSRREIQNMSVVFISKQKAKRNI